MQSTQLSALIVALSVALAVAVLLWRRRVRRLNRESPESQYRRDIQVLQRRHRTRVTERSSDDIWSVGVAADSPHSRAKKGTTWVAVGTLSGCGGCGGCGCGG